MPESDPIRVLVTGATGCIGRNAVAALRAAGAKVIATSRSGAGFQADLLDPGSAGAWNCKLASDTKKSEFYQEIYDTAVKQRDARLLSYFMTKA